MARPPLALGHHGSVTTTREDGRWVTRCRVRDLDGVRRTETYAYQSGYARKLLAQGTAAGVLTVLDARGVDVTDEARTRITGCSDLDQLDVWLRRAVTAGSVHELFG